MDRAARLRSTGRSLPASATYEGHRIPTISMGGCEDKSFMAMNLAALLPTAAQWQLANWKQQLPVIAGFEDELKALSERDLRKRSLSLRFRAKSGEPLAKIMPEAFALTREAGRRTI